MCVCMYKKIFNKNYRVVRAIYYYSFHYFYYNNIIIVPIYILVCTNNATKHEQEELLKDAEHILSQIIRYVRTHIHTH